MEIHPEAPKVTLYSKPSCGPCVAVGLDLKKHGIQFEKVDITQDPAAYERVKALGYAGTPVVEVGDLHWQGNRREKVARLAEILKAWQPDSPEVLAAQHEFMTTNEVAW